jgi:alpha-galactosidase
MQQDALIRVLGTDPEEGYEGLYRRTYESGNSYLSHEVVVFNVPAQGQPCLVVGCLEPGRFFCDAVIELDAEEMEIRSISLQFDLEGAGEIGPGETLVLPALHISEGADGVDLIETYAIATAERMNARVPEHPPTGWCSWYYFYDRVTEEDITRNLATMVASRHPAEFVQIDDGFQSKTGDWLTPNGKFGSGMDSLATAIRTAGYRPGLWLAPFVFNEESSTLRTHPEMMLHTKDGELLFVETWLGRCAVLDCTHPDAEAWLRDVITTIVRNWGYEYLKLDALAYAAASAELVMYSLAGTTSSANLRRGLEIIREAAGNETFILGCTCHFGPAIGLVDGMRVGPDVKGTWADGPNPSVRHAMRMALQRNWMHGQWWANDPDCLMVRDSDTALNESEVRFLATGVALSGGLVVVSDDLGSVPESRKEMALALLPSVSIAARPVDPADGPTPFLWRTTLEGGRQLVGLLNWSDEDRWVAAAEFLAAGEVAFDVWNRKLVGMGDIRIAPHEGMLFQVSQPGRGARVTGDSGHLTMHGLVQREVSGRVQVRNDGAKHRTIAVTARRQTTTYDLAPGEFRWFD